MVGADSPPPEAPWAAGGFWGAAWACVKTCVAATIAHASRIAMTIFFIPSLLGLLGNRFLQDTGRTRNPNSRHLRHEWFQRRTPPDTLGTEHPSAVQNRGLVPVSGLYWRT